MRQVFKKVSVRQKIGVSTPRPPRLVGLQVQSYGKDRLGGEASPGEGQRERERGQRSSGLTGTWDHTRCSHSALSACKVSGTEC